MLEFAIAATLLVIMLAAAFVGLHLRSLLPRESLSEETRNLVWVGIGSLATLTGMVLGLVLASSKSDFDYRSQEVRATAVKIVRLDRKLREIGAPALPARELLSKELSRKIAANWGIAAPAPMASASELAAAFDAFRRVIADIPAATDEQKRARFQAIDLVDEIEQIRLQVAMHQQSGITLPMLALITFWLAATMMGINLFAPRNWTVRFANVLTALSFAGAVFLLLELESPYGGLIHVSDAPLQHALEDLSR